MVKVQTVELPLSSVAVQVTVLTPTGKAEPEAGTAMTGTDGSQVSVATGVMNVTIALLLEVQTEMFAGQTNVGAVVSVTVNVASALAIEPAGLLTTTL